jgi:hypothetical protein
VLAVNELTTGFEWDLVKPFVANRPDAPTEPIARFNQVHLGAAVDQAARRGQPRESAAADEHARAFE